MTNRKGETPQESAKSGHDNYMWVRQNSQKKSKRESIYFINDNILWGPILPRDALVLAMDINGMIVCWVLMNTDNSVNILYYDTFPKLGLDKGQLKVIKTPLADFT